MGRTPTVHIPRFTHTPARMAAVALVAASAACADADAPVAPRSARIVHDGASSMLDAHGQASGDALIAVLDDAMNRVAPSLGDGRAAAVRASLGTLRAALAAPRAAEGTAMDVALAAARAVLDELPEQAANAPERDVLRLALDAVHARATTR